MGYYINCIKEFSSLQRDIKKFVPEMNMRRRMSRVVKMAVSTSLESLIDFGQEVDAIITATGLGCISDSEKFLANILSEDEQMLNPTPFINSTFNTVGGQIALISGLHCYNNTFTHRYTSFESALIDAMLRINSGRSNAVLICVFDEVTPSVETIMKRIGLLKNKTLGEGAVAFIVTKDSTELSVAEVESIVFGETNAEALSVSASNNSLWCGAVAKTILEAIREKRSPYILNDINGKNNSLIKIKCL